MDLRCSIRSGLAFTLVELLVSISVIAVLTAILLPALGAAHTSSQSLLCITRLRGLGQGMAIKAGENGGYWPNQFESDMRAPIQSFTSGSVKWVFGYFDQVRMWPGGLIDVIWREGENANVWTCPAVARFGYGLSGNPQQLVKQPADGAVASYYYSAALVSTPALWRPGVSNLPVSQLDSYRRRVPMSSVWFPTDKASMAEIADFHGKDLLLASDPEVHSLNSLFCDGRVSRQQIAETVPPMPTRSMFSLGGDQDSVSVPYLGTPGGSNGTDLR